MAAKLDNKFRKDYARLIKTKIANELVTNEAIVMDVSDNLRDQRLEDAKASFNMTLKVDGGLIEIQAKFVGDDLLDELSSEVVELYRKSGAY